MSNLNVMPDTGSPITRIETAEANQDEKVAKNKEVHDENTQKVAETSSVSVVTQQPELEEVIDEINTVMTTVQRDINFSVDEKSGRKVISVYEKDSDKLIRQLPSEDALKLLENLEQLKGLLFKTDV